MAPFEQKLKLRLSKPKTYVSKRGSSALLCTSNETLKTLDKSPDKAL